MSLKEKALKMPDGDMYLEARYRIAAFREKYPDGRFETEIVKAGPAWIAMKARIFASPRDGKCLAEAYSFRKFSDDLVNYLEAAETAAVGRALEELGFGLPAEEVAEAEKAVKDDEELYAALSKDTDAGEKYLPAKIRVALWRNDNPHGFIKKDLIALDESHVVIRVTVLSDGENPSVTAHAQRFFVANAEAGEYFLESAETAAVGRAMSLLGYDLPPDAGNASNIADEAIIRNVPEWAIPEEGTDDAPDAFKGLSDAPQAPETDDAVPTWAGGAATARSAGEWPGGGFWPGQGADDAENPAEAGVEPEDGSADTEPEEPEPEAKVKDSGSLDMPFPFGKNQGKTLGELAATNDGALFLEQVVAVYHGDEELVSAIRDALAAFGR